MVAEVLHYTKEGEYGSFKICTYYSKTNAIGRKEIKLIEKLFIFILMALSKIVMM